MGISVTPLKENRRQDDLWLDPKVGVKLGESLSQRRLLVRGLHRAGVARSRMLAVFSHGLGAGVNTAVDPKGARRMGLPVN